MNEWYNYDIDKDNPNKINSIIDNGKPSHTLFVSTLSSLGLTKKMTLSEKCLSSFKFDRSEEEITVDLSQYDLVQSVYVKTDVNCGFKGLGDNIFKKGVLLIDGTVVEEFNCYSVTMHRKIHFRNSLDIFVDGYIENKVVTFIPFSFCKDLTIMGPHILKNNSVKIILYPNKKHILNIKQFDVVVKHHKLGEFEKNRMVEFSYNCMKPRIYNVTQTETFSGKSHMVRLKGENIRAVHFMLVDKDSRDSSRVKIEKAIMMTPESKIDIVTDQIDTLLEQATGEECVMGLYHIDLSPQPCYTKEIREICQTGIMNFNKQPVYLSIKTEISGNYDLVLYYSIVSEKFDF